MLNIKVEKIYIYPLGGISKINISYNDKIIKEFIILIMGPIFQVLAKILLIIILPRYKSIINLYHYSILIFNLLPIYPLDGGKLLNLIISIFIPLKRSLQLSIKISYLVLLIILLNNKIKVNIILMEIFLIIKIIKEQKQINFIYEKFLLERYLSNIKYKTIKIINNINDFYRNKSHIIRENDSYLTEKQYLIKKFKKNIKKC